MQEVQKVAIGKNQYSDITDESQTSFRRASLTQ